MMFKNAGAPLPRGSGLPALRFESPSSESERLGYQQLLEQLAFIIRSSLRTRSSRQRVPRCDFDDLVQEVWRRLLPYLTSDSRASPGLFTLVHRISASVVSDHGRRNRSIVPDRTQSSSSLAHFPDLGLSGASIDPIDPAASDPLVAAVQSEEARLVQEFEQLLTPRQRAVVDLVFAAQLRPATIARDLGISRITVWRELRDAQLALERLLRPLLQLE